MSSSTNFHRLVRAIPKMGQGALRLVQRVGTLEAQLADLRASMAQMASTGKEGEANHEEVEAMLARAAAVASELERVNALYESLAIRLAQHEASAAVAPLPVAAPAAVPAPPDPAAAAPAPHAVIAPGHSGVRTLELDPQKYGSESELSPAGRLRHEAIQGQWHALIQPFQTGFGFAGRLRRARQSGTEVHHLNAQLNAHYGQIAREYALKVDAVERLHLERAALRARVDEIAGQLDQERAVKEQAARELQQARAQLEQSVEEHILLAESARAMMAELQQLHNEYRKTVDAHALLTNNTNELLRNVQEESRTAGLRSQRELKSDLRRPAFPTSINQLAGVLPIHVVDVGAQMLTSEDHIYAPMQASGACEIVGFEPLEDAAKLRADREPVVRMLPYVVGNGQRGTFHVTRFDAASSLLEPDMQFMKQFMALPDMCETVRSFEVDTVRLDDVPELGPCDYLKLDVQGGERDVLEGARRILEQAVVVHTEVEFAPIYRGQPLFADVDAFLRECGFELIDLMNFGYCGYADLPSRRSASRLLWCDAVYFKRHNAGAGMSPEKMLKAAYIAHVNYGLLDLAANYLAHHDAATGLSLAQTYSNALSAFRNDHDWPAAKMCAGRSPERTEPDMNTVLQVAPGELIDRLSILEIKLERIKDDAKLKNIRHEYEVTLVERRKLGYRNLELERLAAELKAVNEKIWEIEDEIRDHERAHNFGDSFVRIARLVYQTNDKRAEIKRRINDLLNSKLVEEKSYAPY